jgi:hypothetical protein
LVRKIGVEDKDNLAALVRIGKLAPGVDAVSAASSRKSAEKVVSYK